MVTIIILLTILILPGLLEVDPLKMRNGRRVDSAANSSAESVKAAKFMDKWRTYDWTQYI